MGKPTGLVAFAALFTCSRCIGRGARFVANTSYAPLLLIKPPGAGSPEDPFAVSGAKTLLIDIAPTVLAAVGIEPGISYHGWSLLDPDQVPKDRERYYHYYDFVRVESIRMLASEMSRWVVEAGVATHLDVVPLQHTLGEKGGQR